MSREHVGIGPTSAGPHVRSVPGADPASGIADNHTLASQSGLPGSPRGAVSRAVSRPHQASSQRGLLQLQRVYGNRVVSQTLQRARTTVGDLSDEPATGREAGASSAPAVGLAIASAPADEIARVPQAPADAATEQYPGQAEMHDRLVDIDGRLAVQTSLYAQAYAKQDKGLPELIALKKGIAVIRRERFILETIQWNSSHQLMDATEVDDHLSKATAAAATETATLGFLSKMTLPNPSGLELAQYLLLNQPDLFPDHVIGLYKSAVQDLQGRSDDRGKEFDRRVAAINEAPGDALAKAFLFMMKNESTFETLADRINFKVLLDPEEPVLLERQHSNATSFAIDELKAKVNDSATKVHPPQVEAGLGFLYAPLEDYYFSSLYGTMASQMQLFAISVETTYQRLNMDSDPDVGADLSRAYTSGMRLSVGPGYAEVHNTPTSARGGYLRVHAAIEKQLDQWVGGLSDVGRIREGFGIHDVAADIKSNFKGLFTLEALRNLLIFFAVIAAIQLVPFGNVIADLILLGLFGASVLKLIVVFASYFSAASNAKTFMQLYQSTFELQEAGPAIVDVGVQLATFGIGKAIGRFLRSRGRKFKSAEELKNDPIIKELPPEEQAEFQKYLGQSKEFQSWKQTLSAETKRLLDAHPELEKIYAEMDPTARDLLTLCQSPCIPEVATQAQGARIKALLGKLGVAEGSEAFQYLREHLHNPKNRANLDPALAELEGLNSKAELQGKIEEYIQESAQVKGLKAARLADGRWEVTLQDGSKVVEYRIQAHNQAPGTRNFFQSHHGIQGAWGEARVPGYAYGEAPTILLRDSRMGSPHQVVSALQAARKGTVATRTYAQERVLLQSDMNAAGVPAADAGAIQAASDAFFARLYNKMKTGMPPAKLEAIFGDWKP